MCTASSIGIILPWPQLAPGYKLHVHVHVQSELIDCSMLGFYEFMYVPDRVSCC